jgi:hypothetical protein
MKDSILFKPCTEGHGGGSKQGTITASFANLREMFGDPAFEGKGDNITTEFVIDYEYHNEITEETEYGSFCLYDWGYSRNFGNDYEDITWNVGGKSFMDGMAADYAIRIFNKTDVRYGYESAVLCHANWHEVLAA